MQTSESTSSVTPSVIASQTTIPASGTIIFDALENTVPGNDPVLIASIGGSNQKTGQITG